MVEIPNKPDPTLEAMKAAYLAEVSQKRVKRSYLGASLIGHDCSRHIWYSYKNYDGDEQMWGAKGHFSAESGHWAESVTADRLRLIPGLQLWTHKEDGYQYGWKAMGGEFRGHVDGVIQGLLQAPKAFHIWEHKDKDHKYFTEFCNLKVSKGEKKTLEAWDKQYYVQAQINMHYLEIDRHYLTVSLAGARAYESVRTEYNGEFAEQYVDRAAKIIESKSPPPRISEKPDFFKCKLCKFREVECFK